MRLIAIGDIHGQAWKLRELLTQLHELPLTEDDQLVFLGDYVDRGPSVQLTIEILVRLREERPNTIFLRGNHDQTFLDVRDLLDPKRQKRRAMEEVRWWFQYGGQATLESYGGGRLWYEAVPETHWQFLEATELEYREGGYIFVHAGLLPPRRRWFMDEDPRMWIRDDFLESDFDFGGIVVFGHTAFKDGIPLVQPNKIGIDTAAGYGGPLTAAILKPFEPERVEFLQV